MSSNLEDSMVLDEVFGSDFGMDTLCEDFYRAFKEYLSTLGQDYHMFSRNFLCIIFFWQKKTSVYLEGTQKFSFEIKNANATVYYVRLIMRKDTWQSFKKLKVNILKKS